VEPSNAPLGATKRTTLHRIPHKEVKDRQALYQILDAALVGHVGFAHDGQPFVIPVAIPVMGIRYCSTVPKRRDFLKLLPVVPPVPSR